MKRFQYRKGGRKWFYLLLIPIIIFGEIIRYIHGINPHPAPEGFSLHELTTKDGKRITISSSRPEKSHVVLIVHGYLGSTYHLIQMNISFITKIRSKFDIVALDLRNHGNSQLSLPISGGYYERYDVITALRYCQQNWEDVTLIASSMGVYSSIYAMTDIEPVMYPDRIVLESFGNNLKVGVANTFAKYASIPSFMSKLLVMYFELRFPEMFIRDITEELAEIPSPILIAHGEDEMIYPADEIQPQVQLSRHYPTEYITVPHTEHSKLWENRRYLELLFNFMQTSHL